jgi:putative nucleotidyltransferase with HDIG domain
MYTKKAIYDESGRLLLAEGKEITSKIKEKLMLHRALGEEEAAPAGQKEIADIPFNTKDINQRLNLSGTKLLDYPSDIISQILFESKTKPWWLVINTLSNYITWVYTHSINVSLISTMLAIKTGFGAGALHEIALGSLLHDVGKLMVPKAIIQKNAELNSQERLLMRQHCDLGVSILEDCRLPEACASIIQQHHERNDGSGYPAGLREYEIHPYAKIVMIADVVDAVTSYRPYRPARKIHEAIELLEDAKNMFSWKLIAALKELLR